ncbi:MAG TPA: NAD(P)-binding domain-containing protein [Blastocatellia bacterium]|nr:NAD(P)-binding domain-containing protein [Blastocatellia bacterium]
MKIAIFGAGSVGGTLGKRLAAAGHEIHFGVTDPQSDKTQKLIAEIGAKAGTVSEAAASAEAILLATPWNVVEDALRDAGDLRGRIIVDCTNPLAMGANGLGLTAGFDTSGAEQIAAMVPGAHVVKAFNQTGFGNMAEPSFGDKRSLMFVCGDDAASRATVCKLSEDVSFETIDAGKLSIARLLEPLAMLWIHLSFSTDLKRDFAFALLRR